MSQLNWTITAQNTPEILRHCPKCGAKRPFVSSGLFRLNAQQRNLDVWLIHRCTSCGCTWNLDVYTRISPGSLQRAEYDGLLANNAALARHCAFSKALLQRNAAVACYDNVLLDISGPDVDMDLLAAPVTVVLHCAHDLDVRLEKLLRNKLGVSRSRLQQLAEHGAVTCPENAAKNVMKAKFQAGMQVILSPYK